MLGPNNRQGTTPSLLGRTRIDQMLFTGFDISSRAMLRRKSRGPAEESDSISSSLMWVSTPEGAIPNLVDWLAAVTSAGKTDIARMREPSDELIMGLST